MSDLNPRLVQAAYHDHRGMQHWDATGETFHAAYDDACDEEGLSTMTQTAISNWHAGGRLAGLPGGVGWGGRGPDNPCECDGCTEPLD